MSIIINQIDGVIGSNSYLIDNDGCLIIIDTGLSGNAVKIINFIKKQGRKPKDLKYIILTHADLDHAGSAKELQKKTGAKIAIHQAEAKVLSGKEPIRKLNGIAEAIYVPVSHLFKMENIKPNIELNDGDKIGYLKVIHCPGHSVGSICILEPKTRSLFSGDALLCDLLGNIILPVSDFASDPILAKKTAKKIKSMKPKVLYPGHGKPHFNESSA